MQIFRNPENTVTKFIHNDGSETAIKTVKSISNEKTTEGIDIKYEDRNKYSIFISISSGCQFSCSFCYLTLKKAEYKKLSKEQIIINLKEAILREVNNKNLSDKFVKLSWMGMGDAFNQSDLVKEITIEILDWIFENNYANGVDGVDLSTIFPETRNDWKKDFQELENQLQKYPLNPLSFIKDNEDKEFTQLNEYKNKRSIFRLFYSLGSAIENNKKEIIPFVKDTRQALLELNEYSQKNKYNVIIHHMFIEELNSSEKDIEEFLKLVKDYNLNDFEIRILRYNFCSKSDYKETERFNKIIKKIEPFIENLKIQISAGSEVKAACGQFIVKNFK